MAVLVTGGAGYIGSQTIHALTRAGTEAVVIDNLSTGFSWALPEGTPLYIGDVADENLVENVIDAHQVDAIIHFAGSLIVPESVTDPLGYYRNNTMATRNLLATAVRRKVGRFIFSSTAAVYGNPARTPVCEDDPTIPLSPYGTSKLMTEIMLRDVATAHGLAYVVLRYFNVAGADPEGRTGLSKEGSTHLLKAAVETARGKRDKIEIFGTDYPTPDGTCVRDYIHVADLADAHVAALNYLRGGGTTTTLNCGYGHGYSVREVIEAVKRVSGTDFQVDEGPRRAGDSTAVIADASRIRATLEWTPRHDDLDTIVKHALAWEAHLAAEHAEPAREVAVG